MTTLTIKQIKDRMKKWHDYYGFDIPNTDDIDAVKTRKAARAVLESYRTLMEHTHTDALKGLDEFVKELGI